MHRPRGGGRGDLGRRGQRQGQEALHVGGPPAIEPTVPLGEREGLGGPGLAVHRHHVRVARKHHAAVHRRPDAGQKVGL